MFSLLRRFPRRKYLTFPLPLPTSLPVSPADIPEQIMTPTSSLAPYAGFPATSAGRALYASIGADGISGHASTSSTTTIQASSHRQKQNAAHRTGRSADCAGRVRWCARPVTPAHVYGHKHAMRWTTGQKPCTNGTPLSIHGKPTNLTFSGAVSGTMTIIAKPRCLSANSGESTHIPDGHSFRHNQ